MRSLLSKCPLQEPTHDGEVSPLIVRREDDGVLVAFGSHLAGSTGRPCEDAIAERRKIDSYQAGCCSGTEARKIRRGRRLAGLLGSIWPECGLDLFLRD